MPTLGELLADHDHLSPTSPAALRDVDVAGA
jgi:hypothetical protein